EKGFTDEELATVHTPIGVSIKAVTPAEIAISILGEMILCRAENKGK
ncbi:MAG: XdhC family protein, partial [Lachnospiraceae bacterium]|nr:XdhC family protein [Candidatus Equihabitans merdae]